MSLDDVAHILYTSGSTGSPRAVRSTHRPLAHFLDWYVETFAITSVDRFAMASGVAHDPILRDVFTPLTIGATLCIPPPHLHRLPGEFLHWLRNERISVLHLTPQLARLLASADRADSGQDHALPDLRLVVSAVTCCARMTPTE